MKLGVVLASILLIALAGPAFAQKVPQGDTLQSIARLPDWAGTWEITSYKDHMIGHGRAPYRNLNPPFNAKWRPKFEDYKKIVADGGSFPSRMERCVSLGMPGVLDHPGFAQFLFTPKQVTILTRGVVRIIPTDGRVAKSDVETLQGTSAGHWEAGGVLVVDTVGLDAGNEFVLGIGQGKNSSVAERIHLIDKDHLVDEVTLTAPEVLEKPYSYKVTYERSSQPFDMMECNPDALRNVNGATGAETFDLTPPPADAGSKP